MVKEINAELLKRVTILCSKIFEQDVQCHLNDGKEPMLYILFSSKRTSVNEGKSWQKRPESKFMKRDGNHMTLRYDADGVGFRMETLFESTDKEFVMACEVELQRLLIDMDLKWSVCMNRKTGGGETYVNENPGEVYGVYLSVKDDGPSPLVVNPPYLREKLIRNTRQIARALTDCSDRFPKKEEEKGFRKVMIAIGEMPQLAMGVKEVSNYGVHKGGIRNGKQLWIGWCQDHDGVRVDGVRTCYEEADSLAFAKVVYDALQSTPDDVGTVLSELRRIRWCGKNYGVSKRGVKNGKQVWVGWCKNREGVTVEHVRSSYEEAESLAFAITVYSC